MRILNNVLHLNSAYAPVSVITRITTSTTVAYKPDEFINDTAYNVYWYNVDNEAFGFAPQSIIKLTEYWGGDDEDRVEEVSDATKTTKDRLSWSQKKCVNFVVSMNTTKENFVVDLFSNKQCLWGI